MEAFDATRLSHIATGCLYCGKVTGSNKENFRIRTADGGFVAIKT
jgi:hypothetical protein